MRADFTIPRMSFIRKEELVKFFIETANIEEIRKVNDLGVIDRVTTNASLKKGRGLLV